MTMKGKMTKLSVAIITAIVMVLCAMSMLLAACGSTVSISLDVTEKTMYVGDALRITATVTGDDDAEIQWTSSDTAVATVKRGTVSAVGKGESTITAALENGNSATCKITVSERTVTISKTSATINLDESNTLTLTAEASDGGTISWTSSNPSVATVTGGVVTGLDIGTATITAQRGTAMATCEVTVTEPSRPADYYKITKLTNAEVVADPGVWHYHADGSLGSDYAFEEEPLHRDSTASVTLSAIPKVANGQYFYFRYQPDQVKVDEYYTLTAKITLSTDATMRIGSRGADNKFAALEEEFTANTEKTVEYVGYRNEAEPFSVRINNEIDAEKVTITVKLVSVVKNDGANLPPYHVHEPEPEINYEEIEKDASSYTLEMKTNGEVVENPSKWYYNKGAASTTSAEPEYNNGTITFNFTTLSNANENNDNQLRFRPNIEGQAKIKVEFTVSGNADANIVLALGDCKTYVPEGWTAKKLEANASVTFSAEFVCKENKLIFIQVRAADSEKTDAEFTFLDIKIYKEVAGTPVVPDNPDTPATPDGATYELNPNGNGDGSKANVCANAGVWFYMIDNGFDTSTMTAAKMENGTLTWSFTKMQAKGFYLRLQPDFEVGTNYKISFDVVLNRTGADTIKPRSEGSNNYVTLGTTSDEVLHVDFEDKVVANNPFAIMLNIEDATEENPLVLTISNITITAN